jgi:hypothetical protein
MDAIDVAKKILTSEPPLTGPLRVEGHEKCSLVVSIVDDRYFVIYKNVNDVNTCLIKKDVPTNQIHKVFYHVHFVDNTDCRIFILTKVVRVFVMNCDSCIVSVKEPVFGALEFFKCNDTNLFLNPATVGVGTASVDSTEVSSRVHDDDRRVHDDDNRVCPLVTIEECGVDGKIFQIFQGCEEYFYVVYMCENVSGCIVDPKTRERSERHEMGKLLWGDQERNIITLSKKFGFAAVSFRLS